MARAWAALAKAAQTLSFGENPSLSGAHSTSAEDSGSHRTPYQFA